MIPVISLAAILGAVSGINQIQGTPFSAGFGVIGLIGPINHLNIVGWSLKNIILSLIIFIIIPILGALLVRFVYVNKTKLINDNDYKVNI